MIRNKEQTVFDCLLVGARSGLVAKSGGGQDGATQLGYGVNHITVVAESEDSAMLPQAIPGAEVCVINTADNQMAVYPTPGERINTLDPDNSQTVNVGVTRTYCCAESGTWFGKSNFGWD